MDMDTEDHSRSAFDLRPTMEPALPTFSGLANLSTWKPRAGAYGNQNNGDRHANIDSLFTNGHNASLSNGCKTHRNGGPLTQTNGRADQEEEDPYSWLLSPEKLAHLRDLKNVALGNARLLYGSDRNRYHDVVTAHIPSNAESSSNGGTPLGTWIAILIITIDGTTRALREERSQCPIKATQALVAGLNRDTGLLFSRKFSNIVGAKFRGQQGITGSNGLFSLFDDRTATLDVGKRDDTRDMDRSWRRNGGPDFYNGDAFRVGGEREGERERGIKRNKVSYEDLM